MNSSGGNFNEQFDAAVFIVQNLPKEGPITTSNDEKLKFYSLFKQATVGKCDQPKPRFYDIEGNYKWNAWNALGDMEPTQAKEMYVNLISDKINIIKQKYNTNEWLNGELAPLLEPKLAVLGFLKNEKDEKNIDQENSSIACPLSDTEYADALEEEEDDEINQSRSSSFAEHRNRRHVSSPSLRSSCIRLERELKTISEQIEKLGRAVEDRHNLLLHLMKKATFYVLVPRSISYRTIIFFVFWPFVAHFLLKWLKRFLLFLRYF